MKLSCALVGAQVHFFSVDIDAKKTVADLKIAIQKKLLEYVNVDKLQLYLAKKCDGLWLTENDVKNRVKATARLTLLNSARLTLQRVQLRDGNEQHDAAGNRLVHVLVVVPSD
eukprot:jgi/Phyca11/53297/gw1.480.6.1